MNDLLPPARRSIPEQRRKRMRDKLDAEIDAGTPVNRRVGTARRFGLPAVAAAAAAAIAIGGYLLASDGDGDPGGLGTTDPAGQDDTPPKQPGQDDTPPKQQGHKQPTKDREDQQANGVAEPWPPSTPGQPLSGGEHVDSDIEHTGLRSSTGREALLFAVASPARRDVVLGYRDDAGTLREITPVIGDGVDLERHPWMSFNAFSAGAVGDGWVTYGYVADSRVESVRISSMDGSTVRATWGRPDAVLPGARMFWSRGTGLRIERMELLDADGAVIEQCDYFECPQ